MKEKIAIQGISGAFHHSAADSFFEKDYELVPCETFKDVARSLDKSQCTKAVMAIENTIAGAILPNYGLIVEHGLQIIGEIFLPIEHYLMGLPGQNVSELKQVISHPMALLQCHSYFEDKQNIRLVEKPDTAGSAKWLKENPTQNLGVIAPKRAAEEYELEILAESIQTIKKNFTRFFVLQKRTANAVVNFNKVSIRFSLKNEIGSLHKVLMVFEKHELNMTKIQSVPVIEKPWEYAFLVDLEINDWVDYKNGLIEIDTLTNELLILGEYIKGKK